MLSGLLLAGGGVGLSLRGGGRQDDGAEALAVLHERDLLLAYLFPSRAAGPLGGGQEVHVFHKCGLQAPGNPAALVGLLRDPQ